MATNDECKEVALLRGLDAHREYEAELKAHLAVIDRRYDGQPLPAEARDEYEHSVDQLEEIQDRLEELEARDELNKTLANSPHGQMSGFGGDCARDARTRGLENAHSVRTPNVEQAQRKLEALG